MGISKLGHSAYKGLGAKQRWKAEKAYRIGKNLTGVTDDDLIGISAAARKILGVDSSATVWKSAGPAYEKAKDQMRQAAVNLITGKGIAHKLG